MTAAMMKRLPDQRGRDRKIQLACFWSAAVFLNAFGVGLFMLGNLLPPLSPSLSALEIASFYKAHGGNLRIGMMLLVTMFGFNSAFTGLVVSQMKHMKGIGATLPYAYLACLASTAVPSGLLYIPMFTVAAFRETYSPEVMLLANDLGYASFIGVLGSFFFQYLILALAILLDERKLYPKWLAYVCIWSALTEVMAVPLWIFKTGPFSWNGLLVFWIGLPIYVGWQVCLMVAVWKAMAKIEEDRQQS